MSDKSRNAKQIESMILITATQGMVAFSASMSLWNIKREWIKQKDTSIYLFRDSITTLNSTRNYDPDKSEIRFLCSVRLES